MAHSRHVEMLTRDQAELRRLSFAGRSDNISRSLENLYGLYLDDRGYEQRQLKWLRLSVARTYFVLLAAVAILSVVGWKSESILIVGCFALAMNRALDLVETWWGILRRRGPVAAAFVPQMVEILFSSKARYPYWWYASHGMLLLLCTVPLLLLIFSSLSPARLGAFTAAWFVMVASMYLTPAAPPYVVVSSASTLEKIGFVAGLSLVAYPLSVISLLDFDLLRPESGDGFLRQRALYDAAKGHYLFRTRSDWRDVFVKLAHISGILVVDAREPLTEAVRYEIGEIAADERLLKKSMFVTAEGNEIATFVQIKPRPERAIFVTEHDLKVLLWALVHRHHAVTEVDGYIWHPKAVSVT